jgi:WD40 repeat protein
VAQGVHEKPGDSIGRYKLLQPIGEGGCGIVYMAEQEQPVRRRVALKVIKLGMDTRQVIARFEAERQALAMMDHPHIAKVLDAGATDTGRPYFVMELVRGIKITDYCDQNHLTTRQRLDLFIPVCQAIQHAHQKGIIHRDIKPSNILVTLHDGMPVPKVIDFGIAKATEGRLTDQTLFTAFEQFIGTPAYMSPEQAEMSGLDIDTRSDIYSLGVLLYELLTGRTPLDSKELLDAGLDELRRTIREKDPMRPSTRLRNLLEEEKTTTAKRRGVDVPRLIHLLSGDLDWIVMKCLEKDRTRRYETANGLVMDIQRHLQNEPVTARPPTTAYRLRKAIRRHKLAVAAAGAIAAALALGVVASTWQAIIATRAKSEADTARKAANVNAALATAESHRANAAKHDAEENLLNANRNLYVAQMNLAGAYWDQNNIREVRQLLEDTKDYPDRGFEWYYWQRQTHLEIKTIRGHSSRVLAVAFSPDGRRIVTASVDQTVRIWDTATGIEVATLSGHRASVQGAAFSPDGHRILTGSADQTARLWDAATGEPLLLLRGHVGEVRSVAFSPDGRRVVTASLDRTAIVWDANIGKELLRLKGHTRGINAVAFSPDGKWILTGSSDRTARLWNAENGEAAPALEGHEQEVRCVAFSPDGHRIITGSEDCSAKVWDLATKQVVLTLKTQRAVYSVAFSPDGRRIATGHWDDPLRLWDAVTGQPLFTIKGHGSGAINSLAFSADGRQILTGSDDGTAKVWDAERDRAEIRLHGHTNWVWSVAISPDGRRVATGSFDHTAKIWDATTSEELLTLAGDIGRVLGVAFSADGQRIAAWSDPGGGVYDAASGQRLFPLRPDGGIEWAGFSSDSKCIWTVSAGDRVEAWNAGTGKDLGPLFKPNHRGLQPVAVSPDGRRVVTSDAAKKVEIWEVEPGKNPIVLGMHLNSFDVVVFSPDGKRLFTAGSDPQARNPIIWNAVTGEEQLSLRGHNGEVEWAAFFSDGRRIITAGFDGTCRVWDADTGNQLLTLPKSNFDFRHVEVSRDGRRVVAGGVDNDARIWEAASTEEVSKWREEEAAAADRLAETRRQQPPSADQNPAPDPGKISQWLVLAPIPMRGRTHEEAVAELDRQQLPEEAQLHPQAGERVVIDGTELVWKLIRLEGETLDLNEFLGAMTEWSVGYAVCYIQSDRDQKGLVMTVDRDDWAKILLNGTEIYYRGQEYIAPPDWELDIAAGLDLKAGNNTLIFKLMNEEGGWYGSVRFTDSAGEPLKGVNVTLTPAPVRSPGQ